MHMLYNSDSYAVVQFDIPSVAAPEASGETAGAQAPVAESPGRGGYEIVDKFARKEIFIQGELAASFKQGVEALIETGPSEEDIDTYIEGFASLMLQPVVLH
jgi:hypothetical protein